MNGLNLDNIEDQETHIGNLLFGEDSTPVTENQNPADPEEIVVTNPADLFEVEEQSPESNKQTTLTSDNPYQVFGNTLYEVGVLTAVTEDDLKSVEKPEDLGNIIEKEVASRLDETSKRVNEALTAGVTPDVVKQYEGVITYLETIKEDDLLKEDEEGEKIRQELIMADFINRGFSKERAAKETTKSFNSGSDIDDAKEALVSVKSHYTTMYNNEIKIRKDQKEEIMQQEIAKHQKIEKMILEDKDIFPGLELSKETRQKIADNTYKPVYVSKDGKKFSALQKFQQDNPEEFAAKLGVIFTLTDGFKDLSKLVQSNTQATVKGKYSNMEKILKGENFSAQGVKNVNLSGLGPRGTGTIIIDD